MKKLCFSHLAILMFLGFHAVLLETSFAMADSCAVKHLNPNLLNSMEFAKNTSKIRSIPKNKTIFIFDTVTYAFN
ncbi:MAG: hypothetical protein C3F18_11155 [Nitrosomonadales bacterium]|nr:MAG: hypothetical protein C3F18_11155 [Nitrosomonadales bacterium]